MEKITLRSARVNAGLTSEEVAKMIGVAPVTIRKWELNKTSPNIISFKRLCKIYGCELDDIFIPEELTKSE